MPDDDLSDNETPETSNLAVKFKLEPAMGEFWESVAHHKILVNFNDPHRRFNLPVFPVTRQISLFNSKTENSTEPKIITISNCGVS